MIEVQVRQAYLDARRKRDQATLDTLSIIISGVDNLTKSYGTSLTDDHVRSIIKKNIESLGVLKTAKENIGRDVSVEISSIRLLHIFLPKELDEKDMVRFINDVIGEERGVRLIPKVMQEVAERSLTVDNRRLVELVKG